MSKIKTHKISLLLLIFLLASCNNQQSDENIESKGSEIINENAISQNNRGVGEMGAFDYDKATETFEKLVAEYPKWNLAKQNLSIALLNRQKPDDEKQAMEIAQELLSKDADNLVAHYIVAILKFNQGLCDEALPHFQEIINSKEADAYTLYFAGQCYLQNGEAKKALDYYRRSLKQDSYLRSAYYGSFMAAQRLDKMELAQEMLNQYQKLEANPKAGLAEIKYTRMGPKATAQAYNDNIADGAAANIGSAPYFSESHYLDDQQYHEIDDFGFVNLRQDETTQMYIISNSVLKIMEGGKENTGIIDKYTITLDKGNHHLAWGDINNDNLIDLYVSGNSDQLFLQTEKGLEGVDMNQYGFGSINSIAVRLADADHDGDLDIMLLDSVGRFEVWNNNLDGTFRKLSSQSEFPESGGYKSIFIQDVDRDRDADIVLLADNKITTMINDRMWDYAPVDFTEFSSQLISLVFTDNNLNGYPELNLLTKKGIKSLEFERETGNYSESGFTSQMIGEGMLTADVNGNGKSEFLVISKDAIAVLDHKGQRLENIHLDRLHSVKIKNTVKGPELYALNDSGMQFISASDSRGSYILFNLSGKEDSANSVRSNYSGIGAGFSLRSRNFYSVGDSFHNESGVGQDYQPVMLASGKYPVIDYLSMEWSDGVYQSEVGLNSGQYYHITETQRQLSSCPVIFVKNNGRYEFVSDVLGVGGIGFALGRHQYGIPRPRENYLLEQNQISSDTGMFKVQFTEPMEESAYLDEMSMEVLDVPNILSVTLDERMSVSEPHATGNPVYYNHVLHPQSVTDISGRDVTANALNTDKRAIEIVNKDSRFLGLVDEQIVTMKFDQDLQGHYQLIMNGWVEYGYSQTMFAAWQAGKTAEAPTLEYKANEQWKPLLAQFGYPAGMPRNASVPVLIPEVTRELRIRTNMEIYFDELSLIKPVNPSEVSKHQLKLHSATLKQLGFPKRMNNAQRVPDYDFSDISPFWDTRYMKGAYTRLGDVTELVGSQDNALAIIGAGEAIELSFTDDLPELEPGFKRYYILSFKGWAKDMDILTQNGETLSPVPHTGAISERAKFLNQKYNTRFQAGK